MFKGNPAVIRKILKKPEDISHIPKSGATIQFSYKLHSELTKVTHLLPENTLIYRSEIVPGLVAETDGVDNLAKPQAEREIRCALSQLVCKLGPMGRRIDMEVCDLLNKERVLKDNVAPNGEHLVILEKRLKIGIHNGWTYIKEPCLYYLMPRDKLGSRYSGSLAKLDTSATALMLRNVDANFETLPRMSAIEDLMLTNPVEFTSTAHPAIALVFYLEYVLGLQSAKVKT
uniref:Uncharacterized protein n=1 Tax=Romanomermis culicivorax TaxID=13658 RepID=A0A915KQB0_ROMCU